MQRWIASPMLALSLLPLTAAATARTLVCESVDGDYRYCRTDTGGQVRLLTELSATPCERGRNWDYDRDGVWVDAGCAARFQVGWRRAGHELEDGEAETPSRAALLDTMLSQREARARMEGRLVSPAPNWLVGSFRGYNRTTRESVALIITPDGAVSVHIEGRRLSGGIEGEVIDVGGVDFEIHRTTSGFQAIQSGRPDNVVYFDRVR